MLNNKWWLEPINILYDDLLSNPTGLSAIESAGRLLKFGRNVINPYKKSNLILQLFSRFLNPLVLLLVVASLISAFTGDITSFIIIISMIAISVALDFIQEYRAEVAAESLRQSVAIKTLVFRDKQIVEINVEKLVPGDVVLLSAGNLVPADGRIIEAHDFFVNQAFLTGEPYPIKKLAADLLKEEVNFNDAPNAIFAGTSVISGSARMLVCVTGEKTTFGNIASSLNSIPQATAFELGLRQFSMLIVRLTFLLVLFTMLVNMLLHRPLLESFMFALALAVGLTPELLPMIVTVTLSRGAIRMSRQKVIVKRLAAIHNLGSMDVLCIDKTGTLTEAKIHLGEHIDCNGQDSKRVFLLAYLNSYFETGFKSPLDEAILNHEQLDIAGWHKLYEVPFDFERRRVSVLLEKDLMHYLVVKGAPENILTLCETYEEEHGVILPITKSKLIQLNTLASQLGQQGFRVLAVAWRKVPIEKHDAIISDETSLVFTGFAAFMDPPKQSAHTALSALGNSGIAIKIVTGDCELVTQHVCKQLGVPIIGVLTGTQISEMNDDALQANVERVNLFCRVTPQMKTRVLLALKQHGHTVGFLGDGINDAPALHMADVSISVDSAVDVAKDAAGLILLDQDLTVLHRAVIEGRRTFGNIMKYVMMGTSSNFGNMFSMAGASIFLPFLPMLPTQILLNNLLYDLSETPLPLDNIDKSYLTNPRQWDMSFIRNFMFVIGSVSSIFDFLTFYIMLKVLNASEALFRTGWFVESIATQVLVIFIIRTRSNPLKSHPNRWLLIFSIVIVIFAAMLPYSQLGAYFGFVPPPPVVFSILVIMVFFYLIMVELIKRWFYLSYRRDITCLTRPNLI